MATGTGVSTGKTAFVEKFLKQNGDTNRAAINEAWKAAGNTDQISESLVYKSRVEQGFTGKKPMTKVKVKAKSNPSLKAKSASKAITPKAKAAAQPTSSPVVSATPSPATPKPVAPPAKNVSAPKVTKEPETPAPTTAAAKHAEHQAQLVDEVEAGIDELIFSLKTSGGNPEVEAALRAARRLLLSRHHGE
jgi:hypothetical protein